MTDLLQDPIFFYAIAYILFLGVAWRFIRKPGLEWVDSEISKIRNELEQVRQLRAEADASLAECKAKKIAAVAEAESIIRHAKEMAARLETEAEARLHYVLARHEQHAMERIRFAEQEAVAEVRTAVVDMAMGIVRKTLADQINETGIARLADQAIADMPQLVAAKARVA